MLLKIRFARMQASDGPDHNSVLSRGPENPVVVLHPRAAFHFDHARDAERLRDLAVVGGQESPVYACLARTWPRHALGACWIVQMHVRIDDREGCALGISLRKNACRSDASKGSPLHNTL